jgi:cell division protein FtsL
MILNIENEKQIKRYLLGELSEDTRQEIERRVFIDDEYSELINALEDELIDDYLSGTLTNEEQKNFESHFLVTPERYRDLSFARTLRTYSRTSAQEEPEKTSPQPLPWWRAFGASLQSRVRVAGLLLAVAALVLMTCVGWLLIKTWRLQNQLASLKEQQATRQLKEEDLQRQVAERNARGDELMEALERKEVEQAKLEAELTGFKAEAKSSMETKLAERPTQPRIISATLSSDASRSEGEMTRIIIPNTASPVWVQLKIDLPADEYSSYRAVLAMDEGKNTDLKDTIKVRARGSGKRLILTLPARLLSSGDYQLKLKGITAQGESEDVNQYSFRVKR